MKAAETKPTAKPASKSTPFFSKESGPGFFGSNGSDAAFFSNSTPHSSIQPKLTIGQPNDKYEQEADAMADKVVQRLVAPGPLTTRESGVQTKPLGIGISPFIQTKCTTCEQEEKLQKKEEDKQEDGWQGLKQKKPIFDNNAKSNYGIVTVQRQCSECEKDDEQKLQTKQKSNSVETVSASIESNLNASKGSGNPLPENTRTQMESSFGADFSNVRIHTGGNAVRMNQDLHAHAFAHNNDIYFNSGKYDTNSNSGLHLLAHELTHTVQQKGGTATTQKKIQRWPGWVSDAADWVSDTASDAAGSVADGAKWVGGQVADGARWVGGKVEDGAQWVADKAGEAVDWIVEEIRGLIDSGKNYLVGKYEDIKTFGSNCFDEIKNGFGSLIHFITTPLSGLMAAMSGMNAIGLLSIWNSLLGGANAVWAGINAVTNRVAQIGSGIWNTVSGFIGGVFGTIRKLFGNVAFRLLPDSLQSGIRSIFNTLESLWNEISAFWTDLWQRLTSTIREVLAGIQSFVDKVIGFNIGLVIDMVRNLKEVYDYVTKFFADPQATIQPFLDQIAAKLNADVPGRANDLGLQTAQENFPGLSFQTAGNGTIQREPIDAEGRSTATLDEVGAGIIYYINQAWADLDIKKMLWETVVNMFWPPATIKAIFNQFSQLWNDDWATTIDSLYTPRNFFDDPIGCLHDIWSNFLILLDFPLALWRTLNNVVGLLMGYITIIVVLVEAGLGAAAGAAAGGVGAIPGFFAGAAAGLATMAPVAEALIASYLLAESTTVVTILLRLFTARQLCEKRQIDILTSVASFITMAVALVLQVLMALFAELVSLIANAIKGVPKPVPAPVVPKPTPTPQPLPTPVPQPIPPPVPQPVPVQPVVPIQPAVPGGGGQVIPFPNRRVPVTPSVPGKIAAKFEEGGSNVPPSEILSEKTQPTGEITIGSDLDQTSNPELKAKPLSGVHVSANGILQTSRKGRINPDACEEEKKICYLKSVTFNLNKTSMPFIGINPTPEDLRIPACVLRTATGTTSADFKSINIAVGRFLVKGKMEYVAAPNIPGGDIHSEDMIFIIAKKRFGEGNFMLSALFSERVPCPRCSGWLKTVKLTDDCKVYCIINNDYDHSSLRRSYNKGVLF